MRYTAHIEPLPIGLIGSLILIAGSALPPRTVRHPALSVKNQLFAAGNVCMFAYAIVQFLNGGSFFFVLLQVLIALTTVLMLLNMPDVFDISVITAVASGLIIYALYLSVDTATLVFVIGLAVLGVGFALDTGTYRRNMALGIGSAVIALFSFFVGDWIFFGLNLFFALFSFWHAFRLQSAKMNIKDNIS